jgi:hypothetical protein
LIAIVTAVDDDALAPLRWAVLHRDKARSIQARRARGWGAAAAAPAAQPRMPSPAARMTVTVSSTLGGSIAQTLVAWRSTGMESRHRGRASSAIEQQLGHDPSSGSQKSPRLIRVPARASRFRF